MMAQMRLAFTSAAFLLVFVSPSLNALVCFAADDEDIRKQLVELGEQYQRHSDDRSESMSAEDAARQEESGLSDEEWLRIGDEMEVKYPTADRAFVPKFLELAQSHQDLPLALDALAFVIRRGGYSNGDVRSKQWQAKERAIDLVHQHHMDDPRVVGIFHLIAGCLPSQKGEAFLRAACESPDRNVRAAACLSLARYLRMTSHVRMRSTYLKTKERTEGFERFWKLVVTPYLEQDASFNAGEATAQCERILVRVMDEFSDVPAVKWKLDGPSGVLFKIEPYSAGKTYAELAKAELYALTKLVPGKQAPDIQGVDADGASFRLSDYRGKVILLTFSANWCGGCVELYPLQRDLVKQFREEPFALLSVSCDTEIATLRQSTESGNITWRCWWDGTRGAIRQAWNSPGLPTIFLLDDKHIIQDSRLTKLSHREEFEAAISKLIEKAHEADDGSSGR